MPTLLPGSSGYERARKPQIARFDGFRPEAIVLCRDAGEVAGAIALGRDPASEADSNIGSLPCLATTPPSCPFTFQNEGDNEPTGVFASDDDSSRGGLLGTKAPDPGKERVLFTQVRTRSGRSSRSSAQRTRNEARVTAPLAVAVTRA